MPNNREVKGRKPLKRLLLYLFGFLLLAFITISADIYTYPREEFLENADVAIVLGAAIWTDKPSPVLRERLNHAVNLYQSKTVRKIIVTGGFGEGEKYSEAEISERYLIENGVSPIDILRENQSLTTLQNLEFSLSIVRENQFSTVLIVSDSLHLRRSVKMARDLGLNAFPSPTKTSRYQSFGNQLKFMFREVYFYVIYLVFGK